MEVDQSWKMGLEATVIIHARLEKYRNILYWVSYTFNKNVEDWLYYERLFND